PFVIRYPRGEVVKADWKTEMKEIKIGTGRKLKDGEEIAILSFGHPGNFVASAIRDVKKEGLNPAHYDIRFVKPLDEELLHEVFHKFSKIITVEDGTVVGGFGSAILEFMNEHHYKADVKILGIPDRIIEHASQKQQQIEVGIDSNHIEEAIREMSKIDVAKLLENK
ncbi:MAG: transketolase C-terminal domain-containing protein, partial [Ginsengibacter sp.]